MLSQHKSERGGDEELRKEQRDAFTLWRAQWELKPTPSFKQGPGLRGDPQCTQVLGAAHGLLECRCRSALAEDRDHSTLVIISREAYSLPDPFAQVPHCQANKREVSSGRGRRKLESCTLNAQAFTSPRAPLFRKARAQKLTLFPFQSQPLSNIPQFPVLLILRLLQALKLLHSKSTVPRKTVSSVKPAA